VSRCGRISEGNGKSSHRRIYLNHKPEYGRVDAKGRGDSIQSGGTHRWYPEKDVSDVAPDTCWIGLQYALDSVQYSRFVEAQNFIEQRFEPIEVRMR
jgi:hypothetical protein